MLARQSEPQQHDSRARGPDEAYDFAEIEVKRYDYPSILGGAGEDFPMGQIGKPEIADVDSVVTFGSQPLRHRRRQVHIEQETHLMSLGGDYLLARQPSGIS
jgi:hypothetical protein